VKMGTTEYHGITNYTVATNILNEYGKWLNWQWFWVVLVCSSNAQMVYCIFL
jgi:hypothetical protein